MIARPAIQYRAHCCAHGAVAPWPRNSCPGGHSRAGFLFEHLTRGWDMSRLVRAHRRMIAVVLPSYYELRSDLVEVVAVERLSSAVVRPVGRLNMFRRFLGPEQRQPCLDGLSVMPSFEICKEVVKFALQVRMAAVDVCPVKHEVCGTDKCDQNACNLREERPILSERGDCARSQHYDHVERQAVQPAEPSGAQVVINGRVHQIKAKGVYLFGGITRGGIPLSPMSIGGGDCGVGFWAHLDDSNSDMFSGPPFQALWIWRAVIRSHRPRYIMRSVGAFRLSVEGRSFSGAGA